MEHRIMTLFARTPVHVGSGNSVGAVDAPVMRERHTRIPIIPGSSLKGVLTLRWFNDENMEPPDDNGKRKRRQGSEAEWLFGQESDNQAKAGSLLIGEGRVLAFPVRSAKNGFAWLTCPLVLNRFKRDSQGDFTIDSPQYDEHCFAADNVAVDDNKTKVILEEYCYSREGGVSDGLVEKLKSLSDDSVWKDVSKHLVIVSDGIFSHFVEQACEVITRVRIDDEKGTVAQGALFNQEQVPSETLFYASVDAQNEKTANGNKRKDTDALDALQKKLNENPVLQVGGDETIGLGLCSVKLV